MSDSIPLDTLKSLCVEISKQGQEENPKRLSLQYDITSIHRLSVTDTYSIGRRINAFLKYCEEKEKLRKSRIIFPNNKILKEKEEKLKIEDYIQKGPKKPTIFYDLHKTLRDAVKEIQKNPDAPPNPLISVSSLTIKKMLKYIDQPHFLNKTGHILSIETVFLNSQNKMIAKQIISGFALTNQEVFMQALNDNEVLKTKEIDMNHGRFFQMSGHAETIDNDIIIAFLIRGGVDYANIWMYQRYLFPFLLLVGEYTAFDESISSLTIISDEYQGDHDQIIKNLEDISDFEFYAKLLSEILSTQVIEDFFNHPSRFYKLLEITYAKVIS